MNVSQICRAVYSRGALKFVLLLLPWMLGCATIPQADLQTFSTGITTAKSQADTVFTAVTDLTSPAIIDYATAQPTLADANFVPVLDPQAIATWDSIFLALQKYSQGLLDLASPDVSKAYEDAAVGLAAQMTQVGSDLKDQKIISQGVSLPPSFAAAFTELGRLILQARAQHDLKKVLSRSDATVKEIFSTMAETIGASQTTGLRGTVRAHWDQLKAQQKLNFLSASGSDRRAIAVNYAGLLNGQATQDLALSALATSLQALAGAHHALAKGNQAGVTAAVSLVEQELQHTLDLSNRFPAAAKTSN